ncbi:calcium/sodium antiporter [Hydrogenophaga sp. MI9]|uniref:calcium/sodium antiporter n=1 Tax=Hydrogenophaga sp. MI9 TaxID=3453719 RepID=UPI003EE88EA3
MAIVQQAARSRPMLYAIPALFAGLLLLVWGAERAVQGSTSLAARSGLPPMLTGLVVLGFGSAAPELAVALTAATQGHPALALGSAWGANIVAMSLVLGVVLWKVPLTVRSHGLRRELPLLLAATVLTAALVWDGVLSRVDAGLLLLGFVALLVWSWRLQQRSGDDALALETRAEMASQPGSVMAALLSVLAGTGSLVGGSMLLVWGAVETAVWLGVSDLILGLGVVALGTTLPELATCMVAARKGEHEIALGQILGAGLFNTLAVAGLAGLIEPMDLPVQVLWRDLLVMAVLALGLYRLARDAEGPARLGRRAGQALVGVYLLHTAALLITSGPG